MLPAVLELSSQESLLALRHYQVADKTERGWPKPQPGGVWLSLLFAPLLACAAASPALCEGVPPLITTAQPVLLAQNAAVPSPGILPTDVTKGNMLQDQAVSYPGFKLRLGQKLPARMWIQGSTEVTQRLETNVFLTYKKPQPDYVFRANPNLTVGYNLLSNTSVYAQYFVVKDCYTVHHLPLTPPTTQSIAIGARHYLQSTWFKGKLAPYLDIQARELFQSKGLRQADLTPSCNIQYFATQHLSLFSSVTLQMRSRQLFEGPHREMDPFYSLNMYYRTGPWAYSVTETFVNNFREPYFRYAIPAHGNVNSISDFEIDRQIGGHPGLQAFIRAEPVFNWRSNNIRGLSGFDFRLYGGLRASFYKPSYLASMNQIKKQLQQQDGDDPTAGKGKGKGKGKKKGNGDAKDDGKGDGKGDGNGDSKGGGTTTPGPEPSSPPSSLAPGANPSATPTPAAADAIGPAVGAVVARALGAVATPAVFTYAVPTAAASVSGAVLAPAAAPGHRTGTPSASGDVAPAVTDKAPPMAHKIDDHQKTSAGQKTALEPQA
jgi:hypothetical protein